jgi:HEAT repeat protein
MMGFLRFCDRHTPISFVIWLAVLARALPVSGQTFQQKVDTLVTKLANTSGEEREAIFYEIADIGPEARSAVPQLVELLADDYAVLDGVQFALSRIGPEAVPELRNVLIASNDAEARLAAIQTLASIGPQARSAVPEIAKLLEASIVSMDRDQYLESSEYRLGRAAIEALGKIKVPTELTVPALSEVLRHNGPLGYVTAGALAEIGPPATAALQALSDTAERHNSLALRLRAMYALTAIDREGDVAVPILARAVNTESVKGRTKDAVSETFQDEGLLRRFAAAQLLTYPSKLRPAIPELLKALKRSSIREDLYLYEYVTSALAMSGAEAIETIPILQQDMLTMEPDEGESRQVTSELHHSICLRVCAAKALVQFNPDDNDAVSVLTATLRDERWRGYSKTAGVIGKPMDPRCEAARGLAHVGHRALQLIPELTEVMEGALHEEPELAAEAAWAIACVDRADRSFIPAFVAGIPLATTVDFGFTTLVRTPPEDVLNIIGPRITDLVPGLLQGGMYNAWCRQLLLRVEPDPIPQLVDRALQQFADPRRLSVEKGPTKVIGGLGPRARSAVPRLVEYLQHDHRWWLRCEAAQLLGEIGCEPEITVPALTQAIRDPRAGVRAEAAASLARFGGDAAAAIPALKVASTDEYTFVSRAAQQAISSIQNSP